MPRIAKPPAYLLHKPSGRARCRIAGRDIYLGRYGSPESHRAYQRAVAEWRAAQGRPPAPEPTDDPTVEELLAAYWGHLVAYHAADLRQAAQIKPTLSDLRSMYGELPASQFGPLKLLALRAHWEQTSSRRYVNKRLRFVKAMFRWCASRELIPAAISTAVQTVEGLRQGHSSAREPDPVGPAPDGDVEKTLPHLSGVLRAAVQIQRLTGARPGELLAMRPIDIEMATEVWTYSPAEHKTKRRGKSRVICVGPRAQALLAPFIEGRALHSHVFDPREAIREQLGRRPPSTVRSRYSVDSYRRAIERACDAAGVPRWSPHRLRHARATEVRSAFGLDHAQQTLGHSDARTTEIYAAPELAKAVEVARQTG